MELQAMDISKQQAAQALHDYRRAVRDNQRLRGDAEYEAIIRGYARAVRGQKLIELSKVIAAGGADERGFPRLAVMRADKRRCNVRVWGDGRVRFTTPKPNHPWHDSREKSCILNFGVGTVPVVNRMQDATAIVPLVPAQYLPKGDLSRDHILWEAEWSLQPPIDPALIQHLGGDLWAVLAVWDLSPLERAVLAGRGRT